jgi:hypothetical protein
MKLAILGSGPVALEAALEFHHLGAAVTWFNAPEIEPESFFSRDYGDCVGPHGKSFLAEAGIALPKSLSWMSFKEIVMPPLEKVLKTHQEVKSHAVVSVTKRFLGESEQIEGKTRFLDLFRIMYQINPERFINEQKENNPETYERLSSEFVQSLQSTIEMYEDFDLVMDFRRKTKSGSLALTGKALGEARVSKDKVHYGFESLQKSKSYLKNDQIRELALIGSGTLAGEILIELSDWLKNPHSRLFVVSAEAHPFDHYLATVENDRTQVLRSLFDYMEAEFEKEVNEFHAKLREWQELDDFVQAKKPKPTEPIPRLVFFSGHNATAIDQLIDKNRIFLTLEKPQFRPGLKQPDNNILELKTIGVDEVLVASPLKKPEIYIPLDQHEVGFFTLASIMPTVKDGFSLELIQLKGITNEVFKLFSPADTH